MVVNIPDNGLLLESSAKVMAGFPTQAFAITLSDSVIEDMIKCVQDGGEIQLSLGNTPSFLFDNQAVKIPNSPDPFEYDLFQSNTAAPTQLNKLPNSTMSVFGSPKSKSQPAKKGAKAPKAKAEKPAARTKANTSMPKAGGSGDLEEDEAFANLKNSMAKVEAEKRENSATLVDNIPGKGGKSKPGKARLLGAPAQPAPRSISASPALSGLGSPSLAPSNASQEKVKQQRFPIIHELAVQELSFEELFSKYDDITEEDFKTALNKVADFDGELQKWVLKKMYWKELDVFQYEFTQEGGRQKAIDNAIKQYDRMRLGSSDPLWQKLLPAEERGKGICLSRIQAAIAKGPSLPAPKVSAQKTAGGSPSGGDSEHDSASSGAKKGKGGEPMSRSSSQTSTKKKLSASEAQAKRLLTNSKKPAATPTAAAPKASPKVSPAKPNPKAPPPPKGGRVLSKEFVTDSDSDNDEVPLSLSTSLPKSKPLVTRPAPVEKPKAVEKPKPAEKIKAAEKPKLVEKPKPKVTAAAKPSPKEGDQDKERDTIRAQVVAKPAKPPVKRSREVDDDDSSSSGTPLSKRIKPPAKAPVSTVNSLKKRAPSDASQNSRGTSSGVSMNKSKNPSPIKASPVKSSPLASSPPTNASDMEDDRHMMPRPREREHDRETIISSASSSSGSSVGHGRKRPAGFSLDSNSAKRQRVSQEVMIKAHKFKQFYVRYHELHEEISRHENPNPDKVADLVDMRDRLSKMKREIYSEVTME